MTASKTKRLLYFMSELEKGNDISKTDYLARFGISERTLKEDVSELKENLTELRPNMKVKYSRKYGSYHAQYEQGYGNLKYNGRWSTMASKMAEIAGKSDLSCS